MNASITKKLLSGKKNWRTDKKIISRLMKEEAIAMKSAKKYSSAQELLDDILGKS